MLDCMQKINFITHFFRDILQRNSKLVILGNLGMSNNTHLKWLYQLEETFDVYLQAKNQLHPSHLPWVIFYCKDYFKLVLGTLGMPGYAHLKGYYQFVETVCLSVGKKSISSPLLFCILAHNSRTRILPNMGLVVKYQQY